ncbi:MULTISPECIES: isochorismatase family protein [Burkholderia]|uniref:isochorismatase family protein n=1 Tax=Burkholderia TaxID=32008 RepID=UPI001E36CB49|nr:MULTISPECIES: isochorismatase family protein [unclassified Burkholderia]UEP26438.1 isochorismatase family protein [Burkholderia sp. B21-007]UEP39967.1 isochorismatase family protein [Burkholderia sp. B21-005]
MAIPKIASYPMPAELPANRVNWQFEPRRAALLVHDMQDYFLDFYDRTAAPVPTLIAHVRRLIDFAHATGMPVFYTAQPAMQATVDRALLTDMWGPGLTAQPSCASICEALAPASGDTVLDKWRYSAFQRSLLDTRLREQRRDQLAICGVYAHIGCLMTACDAFMRDVKPFFVADALADFSEREHRMALDYVAGRCGMTVTTDRLVGNAAAAPTLAAIAAQVAHSLRMPAADLHEHDNLVDCGFDSIRMMTLVEQWRGQGYDVTFVQLAEQPTLGAWTRVLQRAAQVSA